MNTQFSTYIFDFDGTIADTLFTVVRILNSNKDRYGIDGIDESEIERFRNMSIRYLLKEFNINLIRLPKLIYDVQKELYAHINSIQPFLHIECVLQNLNAEKKTVGIITSNSAKNVNSFLKLHHLDSIPSFIFGGRTLFGKHKKIKNALDQYKLDPNSTIYIGDETRDIQAAKKASVASGVVTWGYNSKELLLKHNPDVVFDSPKEILSLTSSNI